MHTTIATGKKKFVFKAFYEPPLNWLTLNLLAILEQIKQRKLDVLLEVEEKVMSKNALDRSVLDIISDSECGTPDDKLRLFLVYFICSPNMTEVGKCHE